MNIEKIAQALRLLADAIEDGDLENLPKQVSQPEVVTEAPPPQPEPEPTKETQPDFSMYRTPPQEVTDDDIKAAFGELAQRVGQVDANAFVVGELEALGLKRFHEGSPDQKIQLYGAIQAKVQAHG